MTANIPLWQQSQIYALQVMDKNNSSLSGLANRVLSFLEWAESSETTRTMIAQYLHQTAINGGIPGYTPDVLNNAASLKEKIAQLVNLATPNRGDTNSLIDNNTKQDVREAIQEVITNVHHLCLPHMTESAVLRHSALTTFDARLTPEEDARLSTAIQHLQDQCNDQTMRAAMSVPQESAAQRLQKAQQMIQILDASHIDITAEHRKTVADIYSAKMKPLKELDESYRTLNSAISDYLITTGSTPEALSDRTLNKLDHELHELGEESLSVFVSKISDIKTLNIDTEVAKLKRKKEWRDTFGTHGSHAEHFEKWLRSYLGYARIEQLQESLSHQKRTTFGAKMAEYDKCANDWREIGRQQMLAMDPATALHDLVNLYATNPGLFYAAEGNEAEFEAVSERLSAVLEHNFANTLGVGGTQHDHVHEIAETIMRRNAILAQAYYGDGNVFRNEQHTGGKTAMHALEFVGKGISTVSKWTEPGLKRLSGVLDSAAQKAGGAVGSLLKSTGSLIGDTILSTPDKWIGEKAGKLWEKGFFGKVGATIISIPRVISKPASWAGYIVNKGTEKSVDFTGWAYAWSNEQVKNLSKDKDGNARVENLFDVVRAAVTGSVWAVGAGTDRAGREGFDRLKTSDKRRIVEAISGNLHADDMNNVLESIGLRQTMMVTTPRIFDEDGVAPQQRAATNRPAEAEGRINDSHDLFLKRLKQLGKAMEDLSGVSGDATKRVLSGIQSAFKNLSDNTKSYEQLKRKDTALSSLQAALTQVRDSIGNAWTASGSPLRFPGGWNWSLPDLEMNINQTNTDIDAIDAQITAANAIPSGLGGVAGASITVPRGDTSGLASTKSKLIDKRDALSDARSALIRFRGAGLDNIITQLDAADVTRRAQVIARNLIAAGGATHATIVAAVDAEFGGTRPGHLQANNVLPNVTTPPLAPNVLQTQLLAHFTRQMQSLDDSVLNWWVN